jgi:hypothetical protein
VLNAVPGAARVDDHLLVLADATSGRGKVRHVPFIYVPLQLA